MPAITWWEYAIGGVIGAVAAACTLVVWACLRIAALSDLSMQEPRSLDDIEE